MFGSRFQSTARFICLRHSFGPKANRSRMCGPLPSPMYVSDWKQAATHIHSWAKLLVILVSTMKYTHADEMWERWAYKSIGSRMKNILQFRGWLSNEKGSDPTQTGFRLWCHTFHVPFMTEVWNVTTRIHVTRSIQVNCVADQLTEISFLTKQKNLAYTSCLPAELNSATSGVTEQCFHPTLALHNCASTSWLPDCLVYYLPDADIHIAKQNWCVRSFHKGVCSVLCGNHLTWLHNANWYSSLSKTLHAITRARFLREDIISWMKHMKADTSASSASFIEK